MTRTINIDEDTSISYIYKDSMYEIQNKNTTTQRTKVQDAKNVLDIVAPDNTVTIEALIELSTTPELLTDLHFTYNLLGTYIQTIQFNDYKDYPLTLDAEKGKMYIMNSNVIFDLTLNIANTQRVYDIADFYFRTLGLQLYSVDSTTKDYTNVAFFHDLLLSFYTPTENSVNTVIKKREDSTLFYTNQIYASNYSKQQPLTYTLTLNPNNISVYSTIANILQLQDNIITLTDTVPSTIHVGDNLHLDNVITTINGTQYSADGNYTVTEIEDNTITVSDNFPTPYLYTPPTLNLVAYKSLIEEVSRTDSTITFNNQSDLSSFLIGDVITVKGTTITTEYETLTVDGDYTISNIQGHVITVEEQPKTDYTYTTGTQPYAYKSILIGAITTIDTPTITLEATPIQTLTNSDPVYVRYQDSHKEYATVNTVSSNTITVNETLTNFETNIGILQTISPATEVLITIKDSSSTLMPNTEFLVDTHEQANEYIGLGSIINLVIPAEICYTNSMKQVPQYYTDKEGNIVEVLVGTNHIKLELLGLYNDIYQE